MLYEEFARDLQQGIRPVYWLHGEDDYWREVAYRDLKALCDPIDLSVYGDATALSDALASARCFPFLSERRVVVLDGMDGLSEADKAALTAYCQAPCETSVLVLYRCAWAPKEAYNCAIAKPVGSRVQQWALAYCTREGIAAKPDALALLCRYVDGDTGLVVAALDKLRAYMDGAPIDEAAVRRLVVPTPTYQVYAFSDYVGKGSYVGALSVLDSLVSTDRDYSQFLGLLINHYRLAYYRRISRLGDDELGRLLGGKKAYAVKKAGETGQRYTPAALYRLLQHLYRVEFDSRTGRLTGEQALQSAMIQAIERRSS